eukprot:TRINITY_DN64398_c0_g1_i1.p1 TRINITY_DN64398_c0_g1~~TRINITY_DN64398_c0_g1_i1.p1  ORF type:complete len:530 (-),score=50.57 TRINITY_DN64398_c0_g1_i1:61-1575(-)
MACVQLDRFVFFHFVLHIVSAEAWLFSWLFGRSPEHTAYPVASVPLTKQYVPVSRNGKVVAYKTAYFGELHVGTPARKFTAVFDTGSGHLILPSARCQSEGCARHNTYNHSLSTTAVELEHDGRLILPDAKKRDQVSITFGTGKVVGEFAQDEVCVGSTSERCFNLRIVVANSMSPEPFALFDFDGVLGLGLSALALNPHFSFFGQMALQHPSMLPMFSCFLARNEGEGGSSIAFGGYEQKHMASEMHFAPVDAPQLGYWQVRIKRVRIGDTVLPDCESGECVAVLDTGTSLLGVPKAFAPAMHNLLARPVPEDFSPGAEVDCRTVPGPLLEFDIGEGAAAFTVTLAPEDHSRPAAVDMRLYSTPKGQAQVGASAQASEKVEHLSDTGIGSANATSSGNAKEKNAVGSNTSQAGVEVDAPQLWCRSLLLPVDLKGAMGPKMFIWGEPMLRKYYTVYDYGQNRIGFSVAKRPDVTHARGDASSLGAPSSGSLVVGAPLASTKGTA